MEHQDEPMRKKPDTRRGTRGQPRRRARCAPASLGYGPRDPATHHRSKGDPHSCKEPSSILVNGQRSVLLSRIFVVRLIEQVQDLSGQLDAVRQAEPDRGIYLRVFVVRHGDSITPDLAEILRSPAISDACVEPSI